MSANDREEAEKWLRLGYETFGPDGVSAVAKALGLTIRNATSPSTATQGSVTLVADEESSPSNGGPDANSSPLESRRQPLACPSTPPTDDPSWRPYVGDPWWFHCDYNGYLENRSASPDAPIGECFYDERGMLVDGSHPYAKCGGTPDSYSASDPRHWLWTDPGGIWNNFGTLGESVCRRYDKTREWLRQRGHTVPPSAPPKAPFPY